MKMKKGGLSNSNRVFLGFLSLQCYFAGSLGFPFERGARVTATVAVTQDGAGGGASTGSAAAHNPRTP